MQHHFNPFANLIFIVEQSVMEEYWQSRYTNAGLAYKLGVDERTIRRWKQHIVYLVAAELNYL